MKIRIIIDLLNNLYENFYENIIWKAELSLPQHLIPCSLLPSKQHDSAKKGKILCNLIISLE